MSNKVLWIFLVLASCTFSPKNIFEGEGFRVLNTYFDYGSRKAIDQSSGNFVFKVKNTSDTDITNISVEASCDCIVLDSIPKIVKSNETKDIIGHIKQIQYKGKFKKIIYLSINDNVILLHITGEVK
jgi:hypothetical protein